MEVFQKQPEAVEQPAPARRPHFPRGLGEGARKTAKARAKRGAFSSSSLLESEKFIDPLREAQLILPEQAAASAYSSFETAAGSQFGLRARQSRESFIVSLYEYFAAWLSWAKRKLGMGRRARVALTREGKQALEQLRYLALLCDACEHRSAEEVLIAESAFGAAYHEILTLSSNLSKMSKKEEEHHLRHYSSYMTSVLRAVE